jgi:hypothetical protein
MYCIDQTGTQPIYAPNGSLIPATVPSTEISADGLHQIYIAENAHLQRHGQFSASLTELVDLGLLDPQLPTGDPRAATRLCGDLTNVQAAIDTGNLTGKQNALMLFRQDVTQQIGVSLTDEQASTLITLSGTL